MKRPTHAHTKRRKAASIDELYGLEPVFEPCSAVGISAGESAPAVPVQCPYCGESFTTVIDVSAGSASYIEDCPVCCRPIEFGVVVGVDGAMESLALQRSD